MQILKAFQYQKIMENKIQMALILTNIKQKHAACSFDYKLVCVDKFSKLCKSYLGEDVVYNFIYRMIE